MACEFPIAVKAKLMLTAIHCLLLFFYLHHRQHAETQLIFDGTSRTD